MYYKVKKRFRSDINYVKNIINDILLDTNEILNENQIFNIRIILSELLINSIKHGNKSDKSKYVVLNIHINNNSMKIQVSDEGRGFKINNKDYNPYSLKNTGRGLVLVEGLSDELLVKGNTVTAIKYL